ncbi:MAG: beta-galactosidase [Planctomycetota bacterium]
MPTVTYDGRGFQLDGRRIFIVSGSVHFMRLHPDEWADRLHACKLAGLNTVEAPVFWSRVEPRPGQFDFEEEANVRRFVQLAGEAGLHVILRVGPFVGQGWEAGGIPSWAVEGAEAEPRSKHQTFLEACSRYFTALADQVRDLQVTAAGVGGPILMVQCEHEWTCGQDVEAAGYLGELQRYMREAGITVPAVNSNNLWIGVEGQIDGWVGERNLYSTMRQLGEVHPDQPKFVIDFGVERWRRFGEPEPEESTESSFTEAFALQRAAAEALAAGSQLNVAAFCPGVTPGFSGGRLNGGVHRGLEQRPLAALGIDDRGAATGMLSGLRPLLSFCNQFARVLCNTDDAHLPVALDPSALPSGGVSVVEQRGPQGSVVWVFSEPEKGSKKVPAARLVNLLLADGSALEVPVGGRSGVVWCPVRVNLGGRVMLDHATLSVLHASSSLIVAYGPSGAIGQISINGTPLDIEVPKGRAHVNAEHEGVRIVVVSDEHVGETFAWGKPNADAAFVGVAGVTAEGRSIPGAKRGFRIGANGEETSVPAAKASGSAVGALGGWFAAEASDYIDGTSPRFARIDGPTPLSDLGAPSGYGWYRVALRAGAAKRAKMGLPESADRVHLFVDAKASGVLGTGPGAEGDASVSLKKGDRVLVMLAESVGRMSEGSSLRDPKGVWGPLYEVGQVKVGRAELIEDEPLDPLAFRVPLMQVRSGEFTHPVRASWSFAHRKKTPLFLRLGPVPAKSLVVLNDTAIGWVDYGGVIETTLDPEVLARGNNTLQLAVMTDSLGEAGDEEVSELADAVEPLIIEGVNDITGKGEWSFAKWEPPAPAAYEAVAKSKMTPTGVPTWWRSSFPVTSSDAVEDPLVFEPSGLTRGQVFVNGRHLGRYAAGLADGSALPGESGLTIPTAWLREGDNELLIFDEHGGAPTKAKVSPSGGRRPIRA